MEEWFRARRNLILLGLSYLLVAGLAFMAARCPATGGVEILPPPPAETSEATATPAPIRVYVSGAVNSPGVYTLPHESIAEDALRQAGGPKEDADLTFVNLAARLQDGQQLHIPVVGQEPVPTVPVSSLPLLVNVNTADAEELENSARHWAGDRQQNYRVSRGTRTFSDGSCVVVRARYWPSDP